MTLMKHNIILLSIIAGACCLFIIPLGIHDAWPAWSIIATIVLLCFAYGLSFWNTGYAFKGLPLEKMSSKQKTSYFLCFILMYIGTTIVMGLYGDSYWLKGAGVIVLLGSAFFLRRVLKNLPKA